MCLMLLYRDPNHYLVVNFVFYDLIFPCNYRNVRVSLNPTSLFQSQGKLHAVLNNTTMCQENKWEWLCGVSLYRKEMKYFFHVLNEPRQNLSRY